MEPSTEIRRMGPNLLYHLGGGPGGARHFLTLEVAQLEHSAFRVVGVSDDCSFVVVDTEHVDGLRDQREVGLADLGHRRSVQLNHVA